MLVNWGFAYTMLSAAAQVRIDLEICQTVALYFFHGFSCDVKFLRIYFVSLTDMNSSVSRKKNLRHTSLLRGCGALVVVYGDLHVLDSCMLCTVALLNSLLTWLSKCRWNLVLMRFCLIWEMCYMF